MNMQRNYRLLVLAIAFVLCAVGADRARAQTSLETVGLVIENQVNGDFDGFGGLPVGQVYIFKTQWQPIWGVTLTTYTYIAVVYCKWPAGHGTWGWHWTVRTGKVTKRQGYWVLPYPFGAGGGAGKEDMMIEISSGTFSETGGGGGKFDTTQSVPTGLSQATIALLPDCP
jgi:hypothetical protein